MEGFRGTPMCFLLNECSIFLQDDKPMACVATRGLLKYFFVINVAV